MANTVFNPTGRIDAAQAAQILGFQEHDIPILVNAGLLKPLGNPVPNARKYFAAVDVEEKAKDPVWLGKATQVVYSYWQKKNAKKTKNESEMASSQPKPESQRPSLHDVKMPPRFEHAFPKNLEQNSQ